MNGSKKVNPLHTGALVADDVAPGDLILCWKPGVPESTQHLTVVHAPYQDEDDNWVVDVRHSDGHETTELTSEVGLSGNRYDGEWTHIAVPDDQTA